VFVEVDRDDQLLTFPDPAIVNVKGVVELDAADSRRVQPALTAE
jgi:hypothetical protein